MKKYPDKYSKKMSDSFDETDLVSPINTPDGPLILSDESVEYKKQLTSVSVEELCVADGDIQGPEQLREKVLSLPEEPGVYMYLDRAGKIIYVGKAKRLRRRVSSYFNRSHESLRTNLLVRNIVDLRFIVVDSEEDALHLENAMIKEYQPRYNVLLKDDKSYPWIVVSSEPFPRVFMTRDRMTKGGRYYGPYSNVQMAKVVLDLIRGLFPIRSCRHYIDDVYIARGKGRLCLDYHIGKCEGPCCGMTSVEKYGKYIAEVKRILNGDTDTLCRVLLDEMEQQSVLWNFEAAQVAKEKYQLIKKYQAKSIIGAKVAADVDMFAYVETGDSAFVNFMHLKRGAVIRSLNLEYRRRLSESSAEILSMAVGEIARRFGCSFSEVIVPFMPDIEFKGVTFIIPTRGDKKKILEVGMKNVRQFMKDREEIATRINPDHRVKRLMQRMQSDFHLSEEPRHIECFDNSNIQGTNPVASCVVFRDGRPARREYRHFNIKTVEGPDDFVSMKEVLHRRYTRMMTEGEELPQLVAVDGGKGQLSAAVEAFDEMGIRGTVALVGIAKRLEEIYFPGDSVPLYLDKKSESLRVIQALRDEAHRFGITHHRNRRSKGQIKSRLDSIKGIGPATIAALMKEFRSIRRLAVTNEKDIAAVVGPSKARIVKNALDSSIR